MAEQINVDDLLSKIETAKTQLQTEIADLKVQIKTSAEKSD